MNSYLLLNVLCTFNLTKARPKAEAEASKASDQSPTFSSKPANDFIFINFYYSNTIAFMIQISFYYLVILVKYI
jgi:hypothetical protein